jgi:hypothetical protein
MDATGNNGVFIRKLTIPISSDREMHFQIGRPEKDPIVSITRETNGPNITYVVYKGGEEEDEIVPWKAYDNCVTHVEFELGANA